MWGWWGVGGRARGRMTPQRPRCLWGPLGIWHLLEGCWKAAWGLGSAAGRRVVLQLAAGRRPRRHFEDSVTTSQARAACPRPSRSPRRPQRRDPNTPAQHHATPHGRAPHHRPQARVTITDQHARRHRRCLAAGRTRHARGWLERTRGACSSTANSPHTVGSLPATSVGEAFFPRLGLPAGWQRGGWLAKPHRAPAMLVCPEQRHLHSRPPPHHHTYTLWPACRAMLEIDRPNCVVNLGVGMPEASSKGGPDQGRAYMRRSERWATKHGLGPGMRQGRRGPPPPCSHTAPLGSPGGQAAGCAVGPACWLQRVRARGAAGAPPCWHPTFVACCRVWP